MGADISANAVRLYAVLQRFANGNGRAWPSRRTIADLMRVSTATVDRAKDELVTVGALHVENRVGPNGDPSSNLYTVFTTPHGNPSPSSHMPKGMVIGGGRGMVTRDALNKASMKQSQPGNSSVVKQCPACLGKNRDIETHPGMSSIWVPASTGSHRGGSYVICHKCNGEGHL